MFLSAGLGALAGEATDKGYVAVKGEDDRLVRGENLGEALVEEHESPSLGRLGLFW